jgi:hypothetical protein
MANQSQPNRDEPSPREPAANELTAKIPLDPTLSKARIVLMLPGLIAIALYMLVLSAVLTFGVIGAHYPPLYLILAALFITASFGLLRLFRWAWALTLSAVFLLMSYHLWLFASAHQLPSLVQAGLNLIFFLYLIRIDVRSRLR